MRAIRLRHCIFAWTIFGLGFVKPATERIQDTDVWWHIKTGELIVRTGAIPRADPFSFTCLGHPWVAHEWLSEVIIYSVFARLGFIGLMLMEAALVCGLFLAIHALVRRRLENQAGALAVTALCGFAGWQLWSPRPQLFTYVLVAILLLILGRGARSPAIWLLIPMFALWSNLHGAWLFGFLVMAVILGEEAMRAANLRAGAACVLSALAVLIGPSPLERFVYPIQYFTGSIPTAEVMEFQSPNFRDPSTLPFEILMLCVVGALLIGRRPMRVSQWVLLILTAHMSLSSVRHIPLFAIVSAPILGMQIQAALERPALGAREHRAESPLLNLVLLLILPALLISRMPRVNDEAHCTATKLYPSGACRFLADHPRIGRGRLLNTYNWGGYLIFKLHPKYLISIDGRADIHRAHMMRDYEALENLSPSWESVLRERNPDVILWPAKKPLAVILRRDPRWRVIYQDETAVIFTRRSLHVH